MDCIPINLTSVAKSKWNALEFDIQQQEKSKWCWAAIAVSVARFYNRSSKVTQCDVANAELRRDDCCSGAKDICDEYGYLASSLNRYGHLEKWAVLQPPTPAEIRGEIANNHPLCARVAWFEGGAHFVVIAGYAEVLRPDGTYQIGGLAIADPWWGVSDMDFGDFPNAYAKCGRCTDSYYTK